MINNTTDLTFKEKNIKTQFFLCSVYRYYRYTSQEVFDTSYNVKYLSNQIHIKI